MVETPSQEIYDKNLDVSNTASELQSLKQQVKLEKKEETETAWEKELGLAKGCRDDANLLYEKDPQAPKIVKNEVKGEHKLKSSGGYPEGHDYYEFPSRRSDFIKWIKQASDLKTLEELGKGVAENKKLFPNQTFPAVAPYQEYLKHCANAINEKKKTLPKEAPKEIAKPKRKAPSKVERKIKGGS